MMRMFAAFVVGTLFGVVTSTIRYAMSIISCLQIFGFRHNLPADLVKGGKSVFRSAPSRKSYFTGAAFTLDHTSNR